MARLAQSRPSRSSSSRPHCKTIRTSLEVTAPRELNRNTYALSYVRISQTSADSFSSSHHRRGFQDLLDNSAQGLCMAAKGRREAVIPQAHLYATSVSSCKIRAIGGYSVNKHAQTGSHLIITSHAVRNRINDHTSKSYSKYTM